MKFVVFLVLLALSHSLSAAPIDEDRGVSSIISIIIHELQSAFLKTTAFPTGAVSTCSDATFLDQVDMDQDGMSNSMDRFQWKKSRNSDQRTHTGERLYVCEYEGCGKSFAQTSDMKRHRRTHTGERPFVCEYEGCGKSFARSHHLKRHNRTHAEERPFVCEYEGFGKSFSHSIDLTKHNRTHTGELPFVCDICGKSFAQTNDLKRHRRTHTGERPFVCEYKGCGKSFTRSHRLKHHIRSTHSNEGGFVCAYEGCGKSFIQCSSFKGPFPFSLPYCENNVGQGNSSIAVDNEFQSNSISKRPMQSNGEEQFNSKRMKISFLINENL